MELSDRQAFKYGFYRRCAEEGLDEAQTRSRLEKAAGLADSLEKRADSSLLDPLWWGERFVVTPAMLALGGGAAVGGLGGYALAKAREGTLDPQDVQNRELIAAYNAYGDQIRLRNKLRQQRQGRGLPHPYSRF
jgi:hypothetical protein